MSGDLSSGVTQINSTYSDVSGAFAALKGDGSVVTWGDPSRGGDSSAVSGDLSSRVTHIYSNSGAFAALKGDGSVVTWGRIESGGDSSAVSPRQLCRYGSSARVTWWRFHASPDRAPRERLGDARRYVFPGTGDVSPVRMGRQGAHLRFGLLAP